MAQAQEPERPLHLVLVGDVMIGRHVAEQTARHGAGHPFGGVAGLIRGADLAFGNLESPLTKAPRVVHTYDLTADPDRVSLLTEAGFDLLSVANNHATDHGREGLAETCRTLERAGIAPVSGGPNEKAAGAPVIREVRGVRVAFLAFEGLGAALPAGEEVPGVASLEPLPRAEQAVRVARELADWVVVSVHWGVEYAPLPTPAQRQIAQRLADAGADVVTGHHPHVLQPLAWLQGKDRDRPTLVAYSLGNFLFDQDFSFETTSSAALHLVLGENRFLAVGATPIRIQAGAVQEAAPEEGSSILAPLLADEKDALPWMAFDPLEEGRYGQYWLADLAKPTVVGGSPIWGLRYRGGLRLYAGGNLAWRSEPGSQVSAWATADLDGDGADELVVSQWVAGGYQICAWALGVESLPGAPIWGRQIACRPLAHPLVAITPGDLEGDGAEELLVQVPGAGRPAGAPPAHLETWRWSSQGFEVGWRSPKGAWRESRFCDADGDGLPEVLTKGEEQTNGPP